MCTCILVQKYVEVEIMIKVFFLRMRIDQAQNRTRLGVPSIAGRLLKVIETCVYDLSLQTHTPLHYILGLSSQTLTPAKR